jgi:hypothetical protein
MFLFSFDLLLAYFLSATEVRMVTRRYLFNLFHIEENYLVGRLAQTIDANNLPDVQQSLGTAVTMDASVNQFPQSTFIVVSSARPAAENA